jgi:hypothetical protein
MTPTDSALKELYPFLWGSGPALDFDSVRSLTLQCFSVIVNIYGRMFLLLSCRKNGGNRVGKAFPSKTQNRGSGHV